MWFQYSPDLSPLDFYLWGTLKGYVYQNKPQSIQELKTNITRSIRAIDDDTCGRVIENFKRRLDLDKGFI